MEERGVPIPFFKIEKRGGNAKRKSIKEKGRQRRP